MVFAKVGETPVATNGFLKMVEKSFRVDGVEYHRTVVLHPGAVVIVPLLGRDRVVVVRQFRPAIEEHLVELPAGKRDVPGEDPVTTARRELQEECGLQAREFVKVGSFFNSPGFTDELTHVVLAMGLTIAHHSPQSVEEEEMEVAALAIGALDDCAAVAGLRDGKSIIGILLAKRYLLAHPDMPYLEDALAVRERFA